MPQAIHIDGGTDPRERYKLLENRRIAQVKLANMADGEPTTLLIRFTNGGTAAIEVETYAELPYLSIEIDGYC